MNKKIWDMYLSPTLSDKKGKAIFITTPNGYNWIYDLYLLGKTDPKWYSTQSPSWENHFAFPVLISLLSVLLLVVPSWHWQLS